MFVDSYNADGEDNFLSANGKSRKEKRAAKKAEKEEKLRQRKGAEISAAVQNQVGGVLGLPMMMSPPPAEEKKGLKKVVSNLKDKREQRQADKLFKKDYEKSKKEGTLSKAEFPATKEKKSVNVMDTLNKGVGTVKSLLLGEEEETTPTKKKADGSEITRGVLMGISGALLVVVLMSIFKDKKAAPQRNK